MNNKELPQKFSEGVFYNLLGNNLGLFFDMISNFIIIFMLSVSDYGYLHIGLSLVTFFNMLASIGISGGLIRFIPEFNVRKETKKKKTFLKSTFILGIVVRIVSLIIFLIFSLSLFSSIYLIFVLISIIIIPNFFLEYCVSYLRAYFRQKIVNFIRLIYSSLYLVLIIICFFAFQNLISVIISIVIMNVLYGLMVLVVFLHNIIKEHNDKEDKSLAELKIVDTDENVTQKRMWNYNITIYIIAILNFLVIWNLDNIFILMAGATLIQSAIIAFTNSFNTIIYGSLKKPMMDISQISGTEFNIKNKNQLNIFFQKLFKMTYLLYLPIFIFLMFGTKYLILLIVPKYTIAIIPIQISIILMIFYNWGDILISIAYIIKKLFIIIVSNLIILLKIVLMFLIIELLGPINGIIITTGIMILFSNLIMYLLMKRYVYLEFPKKFILKMTLIGAIIGIMLFGIDFLFQNLLITSIFIVLGVVLYLFLIRSFKVVNNDDKETLIKTKFPLIKYMIKLI